VDLIPYFENGSPPSANPGEALLRVRVTDDLRANGYIAVYLPTATQLVVRRRDLLRVDQSPP